MSQHGNKKRSYLTPNETALGDKDITEFLKHLRAIVILPYRRKFPRNLTWETGWAWEALSFIDNEINKPKRKTP